MNCFVVTMQINFATKKTKRHEQCCDIYDHKVACSKRENDFETQGQTRQEFSRENVIATLFEVKSILVA